jgi:hypothetical protein
MLTIYNIDYMSFGQLIFSTICEISKLVFDNVSFNNFAFNNLVFDIET